MVTAYSLIRVFLVVAILDPGSMLQGAQAQKPNALLTLEDVVKLQQSGVSEETIVTKIRKNGKAFDLSADELIELKKLGISDTIINYLLDPSLAYPPPRPPKPESPEPAPPPPAGTSAPPPAPAPSPKHYISDENAEKVPPEPGLYRVQENQPVVRVDLKMLLAAIEGPGLGKVFMRKGKVVGYLVGP